ncbi:glutathione transferase [Polyangium aurulentum]|uniref:glutathione transferase n=1 Tax=Polyangium aurulentum TaxID=2567896 RepID=UPI0010AEE72C|nr:glutathione transferase [Polyangium aurulentum]
MAIVLYGNFGMTSPYVFSCMVALREKGLDFTMRTLHLEADEQRNEVFESPSITGRVPALEHDGFWLAESSAIVEYLEEAFPAPQYRRCLPEGLHERARARQIMSWIRSDLLALREERSTTTLFLGEPKKPFSPAGKAAADKLVRVAERLVPEGSSTIFGSFTVADADLAMMLMRLVANGDEVPARLRHFAETQWARPSVREFVDWQRKPA